MKAIQKGFTLIELMIVVAIIAILAAIALPAYQDYTVRSKVSEALTTASSPKSLVSEAFESDGLQGVGAAANEFNTRSSATKATKYVNNLTIDPANGVITVTMSDHSGFPSNVRGSHLTLTPNVQNAVLASGVEGAIDWACASATNTTATARGLTAIAPAAPALPAKYAASECR